jgi:phosphate starvation-inducible PhoH-like protein
LTTHIRYDIAQTGLLPLILGPQGQNIEYLQNKLNILIADRGNQLTFSGNKEAIAIAIQTIKILETRAREGQECGPVDIDAALRFQAKSGQDTNKMHHDLPVLKTRKKNITPRTPAQSEYIRAIQKTPMVFGLGPAGTGKTYLAVAVGVSLFMEGIVERLVFCRPAVEAGEHLGFLPGDMKQKVDPYLRPIYDALNDMLPWDYLVKKLESGEIEIAPLAFMRGRTLSNAFVILDEAQNTTPSQMKMFLTRMGEGARMVITGDPTQTDLPKGSMSGLTEARELLTDVEGLRFITFSREDVVRHPLVARIIAAYEDRTS